ncbi:hypothetical protein [Antribacter gilvus]|uniref:hypothetical protein n=1 Tax=Antribacter gilvus TaxID=2304675 RepID=UPI001F0CC4A0|nr:hypothetical protein [Antribacter gilvus]
MPRTHRLAAAGAATAAVLTLAAGSLMAPASAAPAPAGAQAATSTTTSTTTPLPELRLDDPSITWRELLVDGDDVERRADGTPYNTFGGFGSVSCNNTSNLLLDYKEENPDAYWAIMRMLFDTETGAGLKHIKVEMGADSNSSSGAEPATKRSADEPANVLRGAGFHFISDALSINPHIEVEALRWGEPSWTGNDPVKRYQWYKETIDAAYDTFGVEFDWMSPSQNEVRGATYQAAELAWTVQFAQWLERDAVAPGARYDYSKIKVVALDSYREGDAIAGRILADPAALEQVDALGYHYDIVGGPNVTRLNKEFGKEILYSEGVAPMIDPQYRVAADPTRGGIGGTVGAADIADRFINAYRWSGAGNDPAHMTTFLFQPAVSAMYEGTQYSPKHLVRASDPWSGYWEGDVGLVAVRHFHQFVEDGWEYVEGASGGDGTKGDGGTNVDTSTRTVLTARTPASADGDPQWSQVHANNTRTDRYFEVKVADLGAADRPLYAWETRGPGTGEAYDANYFQKAGFYARVRTESVGGVEHAVYRVKVPAYSIVTLSTLEDGVHGTTAEYAPGDFAPDAEDTILELPYRDNFEYDDYPVTTVGGREMTYVERRGGTPRYTADQDGAFEVVASDDAAHRNVLQQQMHGDNRGFTWNVWGNGRQDMLQTAAPVTVLGDHRWADYTATVDFQLDTVDRNASLENFAGLGVRQTHARGGDQATYAVRVHEDGRWQLRRLDSVVASGTVAGFDGGAWHTLAVGARENVITATLDGVRLVQHVDPSADPVLAGRISLVSGFYNTRYDNLAVTPVKGYAWASEKIDDSDPRLSYPDGFTFAQAGFAHFNRTQHVLRAGQSVGIDFTGTGLNLFGATGAATLEVTVDGGTPRTEQVGATGTRQTSYWLRGLQQREHSVTVRVVSGTYTLDGVDALTGGAKVRQADPAERPVTVLEAPVRTATSVGQAPELPRTVRAVSAAGTTIDAEVSWFVPEGAFGTPYALARIDGTFVKDPSLRLSTYVEVVPAGLRYFVDANAPAAPNAVAHPAVSAWADAQGRPLLNGESDAAWSAERGWGRAASYSAKGLLNTNPYDKMRETGWYTSGTGTPIQYRLTLPAGTYTVSSGHTEWWTTGSGRSRRMATTVSWTAADGAVTTVPVGTAAFPSGSSGRSAVISGTFTLPEAAVVTYSVANDGGNEAPVLSWLAVADSAADAQG